MGPIQNFRVRTRRAGEDVERDDTVAVEEPLLIRLQGKEGGAPFPFVTTMRTPGNDEELAAGLLFAEGVLERRADLLRIERPSDPSLREELRANAVLATLSAPALARSRELRRGTVMGSACGVCGRTSIDGVIPASSPPLSAPMRVSPDLLLSLPERLRERQSLFARTGGLHAAGLFGSDGTLIEIREDIGRHNATDKLVGGCLLREELPLTDRVLLASGRAGFEIVQKAYLAGIPVVASVSAPSSLAVDLADCAGMTLVGFLREGRYNVYTHPWRLDPGGGARRTPLDKTGGKGLE